MLSRCFSVLLLVSLVPPAWAVCNACWGRAHGCTGSRDSCPWVTDIAKNAASLLSGTSLVVGALLSSKLLRLFPKTVLDAISALSLRSDGSSFEFSGKTEEEILRAIKLGKASRDEALEELNLRGARIKKGEGAKDERDTIKFTIEAVKAAKASYMADAASSVEGAMLYVLFRLSAGFCVVRKAATSFDFCVSCPSEADSTSIGSGKSFSSQLLRPPTVHHMYSLLNAFVTTTHALALGDVLAVTVFLEDVVYEPVRSGAVLWPVAFGVAPPISDTVRYPIRRSQLL